MDLFDTYGPRTRSTIRLLARAYAEERFTLGDADYDAIVAHSEAFFVELPKRMRALVIVVLRLFEARAFFVEPAGRTLGDKSVADHRRAYEVWCGGGGYVASLLTQMLHLTFLGSLYSLPVVHRTIGYERVKSLT